MQLIIDRHQHNPSSVLNDKHCMEFRYISEIIYHLDELLGYNHPLKVIWTDNKSSLPITGKDVIVIQHSDERYGIPSYHKDVAAIFKHYVKSDCEAGNIYPLPLGYMPMVINLPSIPIQHRPIDVIFTGENHTNRFVILQELAQRLNGKCNFQFGRNNSVSLIGPHYAEVMINSKISLALPGALTNESYRPFESMKFGCVTLNATKNNPDNWVWRNTPMVDVDWNNYDETANKILNLLSTPHVMEDISRQSVIHYKNTYREDRVALYIFNKLKEKNII
jgi:hypothetical protein